MYTEVPRDLANQGYEDQRPRQLTMPVKYLPTGLGVGHLQSLKM